MNVKFRLKTKQIKDLKWLWSIVALFAALNVNAQLVNNNGALISIKNGATVIVKNGSVNNGINNVGYIHNEGEFIIEEDFINNDTATGGNDHGIYRVQGDWINNADFIADSSLVELYGANQLITGTSITEFHNLTLIGSGVKTQTIDAITNSYLDLTDRELATEIFKHFITNTALSAIKRTTGFVSSEDFGRLVRDMADNNDYLFPMGSSNGTLRYRPLEVMPSTVDPQTVEARMANVDATGEGFNRLVKDPDLCDINEFYYHQIERSTGTDPARIKFFFDSNNDGDFVTVAHWQNLPQWEDVGPPQTGVSGIFTTFAINGWGFPNFEAYGLSTKNPDVTGLAHDALCFGDSTGSIDVIVTGGMPTFDYQWTPNTLSGANPTGLPAGSYTLDLTDANGCGRSNVTFTIDEPTDLLVMADVTNPPCHPNNGGGFGEIDLTVSGGTPGYDYFWSDSTTNEDLLNAPTGNYSVTVTDSNGCQKMFSDYIDVPAELIVSISGTDISCYGANDGTATVNVLGGTRPYTFLWGDPGQGVTQTITGLGTLEELNVELIDSNGCVLKEVDNAISISEPDSITLDVTEDQIIFIGQSVDLEADAYGGTGLFTYDWEDASTLNDSTGSLVTATPPVTTEYLVTVTDENGCKKDTVILVTINHNAYVFPNAFTPTGREDIVYKPILEINHTLKYMKIFNRWGQLVYEGNTGWDGRKDGKLQPMDTYIVQAELINPFGEIIKELVDIILIR